MQRSALTTLVMIVSLALFGYFGVWPIYSQWQIKKAEYKALSGELQQLHEKSGLVKSLKKVEPALMERAELAKVLIPIEDQRESFTTELDGLTKASNLSLTSLAFKTVVTPKSSASSADDETGTTKKSAATPSINSSKKLASTTFSLTLSGDYQGLRQFFQLLNQTKRYITISQISLTVTDDSKLSIQAEGQIYNKAEPKIPNDLRYTSAVWDYLDRASSNPSLPAVDPNGRVNPFLDYSTPAVTN